MTVAETASCAAGCLLPTLAGPFKVSDRRMCLQTMTAVLVPSRGFPHKIHRPRRRCQKSTLRASIGGAHPSLIHPLVLEEYLVEAARHRG
jgi:hypothetical protein